MAWLGEEIIGGARLNHRAGVHHVHTVGHAGKNAEIVGDQDRCRAALLGEAAEQIEHLRLNRDVERGGWLVGDEYAWLKGKGHGDHHALAHAARELVRVAAKSRLWVGNANGGEELNGAGPRRLLRHLAVRLNRFDQLLLNAEHRVERGHRVLEDHGDLTATHLAQLLLF